MHGQDLTYRQRKLLEELTHKKSYSINFKKIDNIKVIGKKNSKNKLPLDQELALQRVNIQIDNDSVVDYYKRAIVNKEMIHSKAYRKVKKKKQLFSTFIQ